MHTYIMHTYKDLTDYVLLQVATPHYYINFVHGIK